jgi:acylphosphatase
MAIRLTIRGKVQGVGYRASFDAQARMLGLSGWVRNRSDGAVEALVDGDAHAIKRIVAWAQHGPALAVVSSVEQEQVDDVPNGDSISAGFTVRATV